jgi:hypothetical protein
MMGRTKELYLDLQFVQEHLDCLDSQALSALAHQISIELMERDAELQARIELAEREAAFQNGELSA